MLSTYGLPPPPPPLNEHPSDAALRIFHEAIESEWVPTSYGYVNSNVNHITLVRRPVDGMFDLCTSGQKVATVWNIACSGTPSSKVV